MTVSDLISRQAVLDAINGTFWSGIEKEINNIPSAESTGDMDEAIQKYIKDGYMQPIGEDLISRQSAIDAFRDVLDSDFPYISEVTPRERIESIPSAPGSRQRGEWVYNPNAYDYGLPAWECDQCGCINANIPPRIMTKDGKPNYAPVNPNSFSGSNFCPNCGAKMEGGEDE